MTTDEVAKLEQRIDRERAELSETVQALAERVDVKARAREAAASARLKARDVTRRYARPQVLVPAVGAVAALVAAALWWRRRR